MSNIDNTLQERGSTYGNFLDQSTIAGKIKDVMVDTPNWERLDYDMKEALDMIAVKIARMLNGDPWHLDSWHDIIGYTRLVEKRLEQEEEKENDADTTTSGEPVSESTAIWKHLDEHGYSPRDLISPLGDWRNYVNIDAVVNRGIPDLQTDVLPTDLTGWWFRGYDGQFEYWQRPDGTMGRYDTQSSRRVSNPTVSELFPSGGGTFNSLYDLTQGDGGGSLPMAAWDNDG